MLGFRSKGYGSHLPRVPIPGTSNLKTWPSKYRNLKRVSRECFGILPQPRLSGRTEMRSYVR
jgi:hypothetical protein